MADLGHKSNNKIDNVYIGFYVTYMPLASSGTILNRKKFTT